MRQRVFVIALLLAAVAVAPGLADGQDADPAAGRPPQTPLSQQQSLKSLMALFIITFIILLLMICAFVIFSVMLRKRLAALEKREPTGPTELEDLWWQTNLPESSDEKKTE
ncbi:MAG: hypothetical protein J7M19_09105 [Planctomycetes bacterium]|nr:hypothetical protein [Planctomycetota bacterium]